MIKKHMCIGKRVTHATAKSENLDLKKCIYSMLSDCFRQATMFMEFRANIVIREVLNAKGFYLHLYSIALRTQSLSPLLLQS